MRLVHSRERDSRRTPGRARGRTTVQVGESGSSRSRLRIGHSHDGLALCGARPTFDVGAGTTCMFSRMIIDRRNLVELLLAHECFDEGEHTMRDAIIRFVQSYEN